MTAVNTPLPVTGDPDQVAALLTPDGVLGPAELLGVDSAGTPGTAATPQSALSPGANQSSDQQVEASWSQAHPGGQVTDPGANGLDLWNFDIARAELKPEHLRALEQFTATYKLSTQPPPATATGYASPTGGAQSNARLATRRAQAVADWCDQNGLPGVRASRGGVAPGGDGAAFARARSVHLQFSVPAPEPAPDPRWKLMAPGGSGPPTPARCDTERHTVELELYKETFLTLPAEGWIAGEFSITGKARLTFGDRNACLAVQDSINLYDKAGSDKITRRITDALAVRVSASKEWDKATTYALTAIVGKDPFGWEIGLQGAENFMLLKSPSFDFLQATKAAAGLGKDPVTVDWAGHEGVLQITGQISFAGRPGGKLLETVSEWAAGLELTVVEGALVAGSLATCAAVFYLVVDAGVNAEAEGVRRASLLAQQMGFAAQLATVIAEQATDRDADEFLAGWNEPRLHDMLVVVNQARHNAQTQLDALGDQKAATVSALRAKYAEDQSGHPRRYNDVVAVLHGALYNATGPDPDPGSIPSLSQL